MIKSNKTLGLGLALALATAFAWVHAHAGGYVRNTADEVYRTAYGECWHTRYWQPEDAVVGCDGMTAPQPVAVVKKTVVAVPVDPAPTVTSLDQQVYFAFDRAELQRDATDEIDAMLAGVPQDARISSIAIEGYTDPIGTEGYNQRLSERRAQAVERYLVDRRGISRSLISTRGRGENNLQVTCDGRRGAALIECLQPNRRATIEVGLQ